MYRSADPQSHAPQPSYVGLLLEAAEQAARAIPPLWPLATSVAVNPFLGHTGRSLAQASAWLARSGGARATMPRAWYRARIAESAIYEGDLYAAWKAARPIERPQSFERFLVQISDDAADPVALPTLAELAAVSGGIDWPSVVADQIGGWAGSYFDAGQALWAAPQGQGTYAGWRTQACLDRTPEIFGLAGFRAFVAGTPESANDAIAVSAARLGLRADAAARYFERLLMDLGGWAQFARYRRWQAELANDADTTLIDLLAVRLVWEAALWELGEASLRARWAEAARRYEAPARPGQDSCVDAILQHAAELAEQRRLAERLHAPVEAATAATPIAQMAFCIDVRSEPIRAAIERVAPGIRTKGFAGFFGVGTAHRPHGACAGEARLPVLLQPGLASDDGGDPHLEALDHANARGDRAWGRFKQAAVSSFAFVESAGLVYAAKLLKGTLGLAETRAAKGKPRFHPPLPHQDAVDAAERILRAMSLTSDFAPLLILVGHGAGVTNNLHASALQCGACGGHAGDVNARLLAGLLNDPVVRGGLAARGIVIPAETVAVGGLHDTTSDRIHLFVEDADVPAPLLAEVEQALARASVEAAIARTAKLPRAEGAAQIVARGRDWAEVRPEWGLAGCSAFIAAPRARTAGRSLGGRAFLHDYDWQADADLSVLELILTAPVVVASWISLQYYGSSVAPGVFGAGNKLLHNAVGGIGVLEGNGGTLRGGLPWQSVHDGERLVHDPLRLTVVIEAPTGAIAEILARHDGVRALFDNHWLHLLALDDAGRVAWRYAGGLTWQPFAQEA
ncbi:YbcC family protein [Sphingomonas trueperi]|uniref:YbcC family protein n=1 Tax=Sphingomonas trueperi TaxID=53317 RepID=UPI000EB35272